MDFVLTLLYVSLSLVSPGVLPQAIMSLHVNIILGVLAILACIPSVGKSRIASLPDIYLLLGLLLVSAIAMILTGWIGGLIPTFAAFLPIAFAFPFVAISCRNMTRIKILVAALLLVALFIFAQGYLALSAGDFSSPYVITEDVGGASLYRLRGLGVLADPNDLGQFFVILIPLLWLWWKKGKVLRNLIVTLLPAVILSIALYYTHSRGGTLALLAVIWFSLRHKLGTIASSLLSAGALLGALALNVAGNRGLNQDDGGRVAAWALGLEVFRSHPLFGVGMDNFNNFNDTGLTAHNSYVLCLAELGIFGYFCWLGMIVLCWKGLSVHLQTAQPVQGSDTEETERLEYAIARPVTFSRPTGPYRAQGMQEQAPAQTYPSTAPDAPSSFNPDWDMQEPAAGVGAEELARTGRILQTSMVGMLTSAFFISRTYSMTLYVVLGLVTALRIVERKSLLQTSASTFASFRQVGWVVLGSIVFLYVFVRLHGV